MKWLTLIRAIEQRSSGEPWVLCSWFLFPDVLWPRKPTHVADRVNILMCFSSHRFGITVTQLYCFQLNLKSSKKPSVLYLLSTKQTHRLSDGRCEHLANKQPNISPRERASRGERRNSLYFSSDQKDNFTLKLIEHLPDTSVAIKDNECTPKKGKLSKSCKVAFDFFHKTKGKSYWVLLISNLRVSDVDWI